MSQSDAKVILVVDDEPLVLDAVSSLLVELGYGVITSNNVREAEEKILGGGIDIVLSDIKMPGATGIELLDFVHKLDPEIPVILMTAFAELEVSIEAVRRGAFDFILKPFRAHQVRSAVEKGVKYRRLVEQERKYKEVLEETVSERTRELAEALELVKHTRLEIMERLTTASEYRDNETGAHIRRMGLYAKQFAEALAMPEEFSEAIAFASPMHDVGKVGISDMILLKPGSLTRDEFEIMKTHTTIGASILSGSRHDVLKLAASISLTHHERWDGTGYPQGLKGEAIPLEGRIVMLIDQYDALRAKRIYKPPFDHAKTLRIMTEGDRRTRPEYFDETLLRLFVELAPRFDEIYGSLT